VKKEIAKLLKRGSETILSLENKNRILKDKLRIVEDMVFLVRKEKTQGYSCDGEVAYPLHQIMDKEAEVLLAEIAVEKKAEQ